MLCAPHFPDCNFGLQFIFKILKYYFPSQAVDILRVNYEPTDQDILYAEGDTSSNGLACVDFSFPQSECGYEYNTTDQHDSLLRSVSVSIALTFQMDELVADK